jgi:hypothetical protein
MTQREFDKLRVKDSVCWQGNEADRGEVIDKGYAAVTIRWADGQEGIYTLDRMTQFGIEKISA